MYPLEAVKICAESQEWAQIELECPASTKADYTWSESAQFQRTQSKWDGEVITTKDGKKNPLFFSADITSNRPQCLCEAHWRNIPLKITNLQVLEAFEETTKLWERRRRVSGHGAERRLSEAFPLHRAFTSDGKTMFLCKN